MADKDKQEPVNAESVPSKAQAIKTEGVAAKDAPERVIARRRGRDSSASVDLQPLLAYLQQVQGLARSQVLANSLVRSAPSSRTAPQSNAEIIKHFTAHPNLSEFESEVARLKRDIEDKAKALLKERAGVQQQAKQIELLEADLAVLRDKQRLGHLLSRVGDYAQRRLLESEEFRAEFNHDMPRNAFVLSIDIRRSTELMLKAREPKLFAEFMITLAGRLRLIILENHGIFDKFTGDGILAFFPEFFSGRDAGYLALRAASECHEVFSSVYKTHRHCFSAVLTDTGLGIGLDYGAVQLVQIGGDFTVVGTPVVYACRMSGATAGRTFVNQPAFEQLFELFSEYCDFEETELEIKHEGKTLAHKARLNGKPYEHVQPEWLAADSEEN
jgi:class 3 adenylate cyclase